MNNLLIDLFDSIKIKLLTEWIDLIGISKFSTALDRKNHKKLIDLYKNKSFIIRRNIDYTLFLYRFRIKVVNLNINNLSRQSEDYMQYFTKLTHLTIGYINPLNFDKWMDLFQQNQNWEITINSLQLSSVLNINLMNEYLWSSVISLDLSGWGWSISSKKIPIGPIVQKCFRLKKLNISGREINTNDIEIINNSENLTDLIMFNLIHCNLKKIEYLNFIEFNRSKNVIVHL